MTNRIFGASPPITPHGFTTLEGENGRIAQGAWLIARLVRREPVRREEYQRRFGPPSRSFCCEVAALRAAGIRRGSDLLRSDAT